MSQVHSLALKLPEYVRAASEAYFESVGMPGVIGSVNFFARLIGGGALAWVTSSTAALFAAE